MGKAIIGAAAALGALCLAGLIGGLASKHCKKKQSFSLDTDAADGSDGLYDFRYHKTKTADPLYDFRYDKSHDKPRSLSEATNTAPWRGTDSVMSAPVYPSHGQPDFSRGASASDILPDVEQTSLGYHSVTPAPGVTPHTSRAVSPRDMDSLSFRDGPSRSSSPGAYLDSIRHM